MFMKKLSMDKLVNTVINERKAKGLTQVQLAEATGINRAMIGRLENSDYIPSIDQLQRLGENLGFEVTDLFVEEEGTPKDMVLDKKYRPQMPWVVHGFRNNLHIACRLMQENIYFSLGERYQPDVLRHVPLECLLAETDESTQDIRMVIGRMAETKNVEVSFLCDRIDENTRKIFFQR